MFLLTIEDAKNEQEIRYRSQLTEATIERLTDMIIWLDEDARYIFVNPAATRLLGYSAEELHEMHVWDVDPLFDRQKWRDHWREVAEKGSFTLETVNRSKMGVDIPIEVTVNFVEYDGRRYNCSIVRDISARKAAESELRSLNARILRLSITDEMTGLGNRRHFDAMLARQIARAAESRLPLSLILLDIDSFKAFNDRYGHLGGDDALKKVAALLSDAMVRPDWLACRYGGEEFACILPEMGCDEAAALAEALRSSIEALGIVHDRSRAGRVVTASFGVMTTQSPTEETVRSLLATADAALYRAKRSGGNCVEIGRGAASEDSGSTVATPVPVDVRRNPS
ncbi:MAG TPA: diguanylate cyclase [Kaistia sp.]|nr:diguanylate cyclase [Kaistia sp.]